MRRRISAASALCRSIWRWMDWISARALASLVGRICAGEIRQSADRYRVDPSLRRYLRTIAGKTAVLFALSFHIGAHESGCPPDLARLLRRLGYPPLVMEMLPATYPL